MKRRRVWILVIALVVAGLGAAGHYFREPLSSWARGVYTSAIMPRLSGAHPLGGAQLNGPPQPLVASGTIEAHTVSVGSTRGGRLAAVRVKEGERVAPGAVIADLDTSLHNTELAQAQAGVAQAEAQLALVKAGASEADLEVLRAAIEQARAAAAAGRSMAQDAQALLKAPGALDVKIAGAQYAVQAAGEQSKAAQANATAADLEEQLLGRTVRLLEDGFDVSIPGVGSKHFDAPSDRMQEARLQWNLASQKQWQAHAQVDIASAALHSARQTLVDLRAQKTDPQSLQAQANAAKAASQVADAAATTAQANLDLALAGATPEQIHSAESLVTEAEAGVRAVEARIEQARIAAPDRSDRGGAEAPWTVSTVVLHSGEVVSPGSSIVHLADLNQVTLTVYVPESDLGRVHLGQAVEAVVDSYPGRLFPGTVTQIANEAEFTPKNVETRQERANTVYAVKIALDNQDGALKPGMPADATFCVEGVADCTGTTSSSQTTALHLPRLGTAADATALARVPPWPAWHSQGGQAGRAGAIQASGSIEGNETTISAEVGGPVVAVAALEGDAVRAGQVLVRLDGTELEAQYQQTQAARVTAQAELARVTAAPQAARVAQAKAQVAQAEAALGATRSALADARTQRDNPQDLDVQINNAGVQLKAVVAQVDLARANLKAAQTLQESLPAGTGSDQDKTKRAEYDQQVLAAQAVLRAAEAQRQGAQATLTQLRSIRARPVALDAAVHTAEGQAAQAEAALGVAKASLARVQAPAQPEAVAVAQASVAKAEAATSLVAAMLEKLQLTSPVTGTVTAGTIHTGEVAQPGAPLLTIVDLEHVKLVIFVPAGRIGQVRLGQQAEVSTDSYPGRRFSGAVTHINDQAEFTPKNVQTQEERVKMGFRVEIALDNPNGALKPGMPADAMLPGS
jgi:HlyD family secretion protein